MPGGWGERSGDEAPAPQRGGCLRPGEPRLCCTARRGLAAPSRGKPRELGTALTCPLGAAAAAPGLAEPGLGSPRGEAAIPAPRRNCGASAGSNYRPQRQTLRAAAPFPASCECSARSTSRSLGWGRGWSPRHRGPRAGLVLVPAHTRRCGGPRGGGMPEAARAGRCCRHSTLLCPGGKSLSPSAASPRQGKAGTF